MDTAASRYAQSSIGQVIITAAAALLSAYAAAATVRFATPIDDALPLIAVLLCVVASISSPLTIVSLPLLLGGEVVIGDERTRFLWFGVVIGATFAAAIIVRPAADFLRAAGLTVCATVLLRWIPIANVNLIRETALLVFAVLIVGAFRSTPVAIAIAVATALFTPLVPLRTLWLPLVVLMAGVTIGLVRSWREGSGFGIWDSGFAAGHPASFSESRIPNPESQHLIAGFVVALVLTFFAWSGVVARALPMVWRGLPQPTPRQVIAMALAPGQSAEFDVPPDARALIVSGANVSRLPRGTVVGRLDPGGVVLRIGEVADWGFVRREHYYTARNPLPRNPAGLLRGYGYAAWIDGAARIALPHASTIRVAVDRALPPAARLQIDAFELERR